MEHTLALIEQVHKGDKNAREQLITENLGLVYNVAHRFIGRGCEWEDLVQIGSIGLLKSIDYFDLTYNVRFSTYAVPMIVGEIQRYLRDNSMIKVSRLLKESAAKIYRAKEILEKRDGAEPTIEMLSQETGISPEEIVLAMDAAAEVESLSQTVFSGDGTPVLLEDRLPDHRDEHEELLNKLLLTQLMELLSEHEQRIIYLRYFEECTQIQVADRMGMTQVQVSRAEKRILRKLRAGV